MAAEMAIGAGLTLANSVYDSYWKQKQISENWDMAMYQNQWNSPEKQVERLRKAGLNPAMAMENGMMSSGVGSSSPPSISSHPLDMSTIMEGMRIDNEGRLARSQSAKLDQETEAERIRNLFAMRRESQNLRNLIASGKLTKAETRRANREADFLDEQIYWYGDITESNIRANQAKARLDDANASLQELELKYKPDQWKLILSNLDKEGKRIESAIRSNDSQAALNYAYEAVQKSVKLSHDIDNQLARDTADAYIDFKFAEADDMFYKSQQSAKAYHEGEWESKFMPSTDLLGRQQYYVRPSGGYIDTRVFVPQKKRK